MQRRSAASAAVAVAVVVVVAGVVALTANSPATLQQLMPALDLSGYYPQQQVYPQQYAQTQMLPQFSVNGGLEVPDHPPGMKWIKTDPIGSFDVTSPDGDSLGRIHVKTLPAPPAPPPTIIRFGDVGVAPAGCPMCPVLDVKAAELQKKQIVRNERKIAVLEKTTTDNNERIEQGVERMKLLKESLKEAIFTIKEAVKKEDVDLETSLMTKEHQFGPQGPKGLSGFVGDNGVPGVNGLKGIKGIPGRQGVAGAMGERGIIGPNGISGKQGTLGPRGTVGGLGPFGPPGPAGKLGEISSALKCSRIGGMEVLGVCFKSSILKGNHDKHPPKCSPWAPKKGWNQGQWYEVAKNFATKGMLMNDIDEKTDGGRCDNHQAAFSFSQGGTRAKVWVNKAIFKFKPTSAGETCNIFNGDDTIAVYACVV